MSTAGSGGARRRSGLTLIEVLLATAILSVGLAAMVSAAARALAVAGRAREYEMARRLLGRLEVERPLRYEDLAAGAEEGGFDGEAARYRWRREIEPLPEEQLEMYVVRTRVSWSERGRGGYEEVVTYVYGPTHPRRSDEGG